MQNLCGSSGSHLFVYMNILFIPLCFHLFHLCGSYLFVYMYIHKIYIYILYVYTCRTCVGLIFSYTCIYMQTYTYIFAYIYSQCIHILLCTHVVYGSYSFHCVIQFARGGRLHSSKEISREKSGEPR